MVFLLCAAAFPCGIANSRITTTPLTGEATLEGNLAANILVKPSTGTLLSTVEFVGSNCTLQGVQPITGRLSLLAPTGQDEKVLQQINLSADAVDLSIGGGLTTLTGSAIVNLTSMATWNFL
jgi:hypothetical protein